MDFRALHRFSFSAGAREELFSGGRAEFVPSIAGGWWVAKAVKIRASASRGFRLPTYTDLYYRDPANVGNPLLRPESSWSLAVGPEFNPAGRISAALTAIHRRDRDGIDYVKHSDTEPWQAINVDNVNFSGVEAAVHVRPRISQHFAIAYTSLYANQNNPGVISRYLLNYAVNNAIVSWEGSLPGAIVAVTPLRVMQRYRQEPYPLWDFAVTRDRGRVRPICNSPISVA